MDIDRQERLKDDKRMRLIEAAIEEFNENGLQNASYNRIIERSGLSKGAVYYYFDNKESLLSTVIEEIGDRFLDTVEDFAMPETREDYWEAFREYQTRELDFFLKNPSLGRILVQLGEREWARDHPFWLAFERPIRLLRALIGRGQELGAVRSDLAIETILRLNWAIGRVLLMECADEEVCGCGASSEESSEWGRRFLAVDHDLSRRMLSPGAELPSAPCGGTSRKERSSA